MGLSRFAAKSLERFLPLTNISRQEKLAWLAYEHRSEVLGCNMVFAVYLPPPGRAGRRYAVLYSLSGLTCTDENFMHKAAP